MCGSRSFRLLLEQDRDWARSPSVISCSKIQQQTLNIPPAAGAVEALAITAPEPALPAASLIPSPYLLESKAGMVH